MDENAILQRQAVELVKKYKTIFIMAPTAKVFFKRLAVFLKWTDLEQAL